ncbi:MULTISPECIES: hypothetical protein [Aureimonas]|jgi:hypothetical protein|uniref:Uncharacterized protein n=1 Tax=Aureimonas phyllosphaerae TaxID=1166078 RepID=A0A7W6FT58_9HYPH|nr:MULTISPECIES: hypothetical protein [Aureimonas]KQQ85980.1 hypothetical protein ASF65_05495 [Aureimonas sp. Leaf324]MBB3934380.1 hypothetical protein [Aureimonas phyllosphaerae]MBB3958404.1 hypothetical protein [Aureimonas phyllosphaerae]SFE96469.1 hypothetical protein SAMN05216566_101378 [Aureimonas phyllosphaerae]
MLNVRTERTGSFPTQIGATARRPGADRARPSSRFAHGTARPMYLESEPTIHMISRRGSMFEASAPQRP